MNKSVVSSALLRRPIADAAYVFLAACYIAIGCWVHLLADLAFPYPWNDEAWQLFPAKNVALHGRIWAPELNEEKLILCYPVHDAFLGVMTWVFGQGLVWARHLSGVWLALAFLMLAAVLWRDALRFPLLILTGWAFVSAPMTVAGNMVRPEALMMALAAGALLGMERKRPWAAMGLGAAGVALHPSGLVVMGMLGFAALVDAIKRRVAPRGIDWAALGIGGLAIGYLLYIVATYWADFSHIYFTISVDSVTQRPSTALASKWVRQFVVPAIVAAALASFAAPAARASALLAAGFALMPAIRAQMWYDSYRVFSIVLLLIAVARVIQAVSDRFAPTTRPAIRIGFSLTVFGLLAAVPVYRSYYNQWLEGPRGYPRDMTWGWGMRMSDGTPYYLESDRESLETALRARFGDANYRVSVLPEAEMILMWRGLGALRYYMPVRARVGPDLIIVRDSRYKPEWVRDVHEKRSRNFDVLGVIHRRDGTEVWTLKARPGLLDEASVAGSP